MAIVITIAIIFLGFFVWVVIHAGKEVAQDWETLNKLKERANQVKTREEIGDLHRDMLSFALKTKNEFIHYELKAIDGFLRGLYKNAK
jgi:hypothetical protein